jgi:hypothetical protein
MPVIAASSATSASRRCDKGCSHTLVALFARHASERGAGTLKGSRTISWMEYRTLWDGVSVALNLQFY